MDYHIIVVCTRTPLRTGGTGFSGLPAVVVTGRKTAVLRFGWFCIGRYFYRRPLSARSTLSLCERRITSRDGIARGAEPKRCYGDRSASSGRVQLPDTVGYFITVTGRTTCSLPARTTAKYIPAARFRVSRRAVCSPVSPKYCSV